MSPEAALAEALLFVTDEPVGALSLAQAMGLDLDVTEAALAELGEELERSGSGIGLQAVAGGWRLTTNPDYHDYIEEFVVSWDARHLTTPALEVLAIVAYTQPATRAQISALRGVSSDSALNSLVEKGLVQPVGAAESPGNPVVYGTTRAFLERFGLNSTADLPPLEDFAPSPTMRALIAERLSARGLTVAETESLEEESAEEVLGEEPSQLDLGSVTFNFDDE